MSELRKKFLHAHEATAKAWLQEARLHDAFASCDGLETILLFEYWEFGISEREAAQDCREYAEGWREIAIEEWGEAEAAGAAGIAHRALRLKELFEKRTEECVRGLREAKKWKRFRPVTQWNKARGAWQAAAQAWRNVEKLADATAWRNVEKLADATP